jgi:cystathionine beta-lyase
VFVNPPVVRGSTVLHADTDDMRERVQRAARGDDTGATTYGIHGNPTHRDFLDLLTSLEGGDRSFALPSGLSACTTAILAFVAAGDHVLVPDSAYGPTRDFCEHWLRKIGVEAQFYDPCIGDELRALFRPSTRVLFLESPGSLTFEMQDVPRLAALARAAGIVSIIDNTWATPLFFQPLAHGVDVSVHAATKYIGGHADLLLGTITTAPGSTRAVRDTIRALGLYASPDDCWLALRGLRSMRARLDRHRATAEALIAWLRAQPEVDRVLYPALADDPGHALWARDFKGASGLFGLRLRADIPVALGHTLANGTRWFGRGYSWGGFESLLIPSFAKRAVIGNPAPQGALLRISAGLEDPADLIADLHDAFERLRAAFSQEQP